MASNRLQRRVRRWLGLDELEHVRSSVIELNDVGELRKAYRWTEKPILDNPAIDEWRFIEDANQRRIRDAECIGTVVRNAAPKLCLEIGTAGGESTALISVNAPSAQIFTVNIPPEELEAGEGGVLTTRAFPRDEIGAYYKKRGLTNITQILANTATWVPDIGTVDVAFVDGCHDSDFVFNDTKKILKCSRPGSFILWHDFNLEKIHVHGWIRDVCLGVERLLEAGLIRGQILHVRDSWVGIYRVPPERP